MLDGPARLDPLRADFDQYGPPLLGIFPLIVDVPGHVGGDLRERTSGTLERLLSMPIGKADFVLGYALAFGDSLLLQALVVSGLSFGVFGLDVLGRPGCCLFVAVVDALLGTALGLFVSAFATTEFQAVQFMPALILPQLSALRNHRSARRAADALAAALGCAAACRTPLTPPTRS